MRTCKKILFFFVLIFCSTIAESQEDSLEQRIFLVGDAGKLMDGKLPELQLLGSLFNLSQGHNTLIYLGDNIYPLGLPDEKAKNIKEARQILQAQISPVKGTTSKAFFIPGNHDWKRGRKDGWQQVLHQSRYFQSLQLDNVQFIPRDGCPGPVEIRIADDLVLVVIDTQWWLHQFEKPGITSDCDCKTTDDVIISLKDIVYRNRDKVLLFASHHPFRSHGPHGGYFTLKQHIFPLTDWKPGLYVPLPLIGSVYPIARSVFGNIQDTRHPVYKKMIRSIDEVLNTHPYCIHVAGHEHSLQLIRDGNQTYLVSGGGAKNTRVKQGAQSVFASPTTGFAVLEILKNKKVWIKYYSTKQDNLQLPLYTTGLQSIQLIHDKEETRGITSFPDSTTIVGGSNFKAGGLQNGILGKNYRQEWSAPVRVPVIQIGKEMGGLKPLQRGGGKQSRSLRLQAPDGTQYTLRSIEKFPEKALPEEIRETFARDLLKDGISASYPYTALSVPGLAEAAGIAHANPRLVYVPDDPALGEFRADFANAAYLLEEREPGGFKKTYSTDKVYEQLAGDNDNKVDQLAVLKARLLDMFIMDFDRHEDQWRWGIKNNKTTFSPIPRDRDQAFFINNGFLPGMISRPWLLPQLQGFQVHVKNINGFNFAARNFDRSFLNELRAEDWKKTVEVFLNQMTDTVIEHALEQQPKEIQQFSKDRIVTVLMERRKYLLQEAMEYYRFLAREVTITGSDKKELFEVTHNEDGSVLVSVYKKPGEGKESIRLYERKFFPGETREIRLFGMSGDDQFNIHSTGRKQIKIRLVGGSGNDHFNISGSPSKTVIYDLSTEQNEYTGKSRLKLSEDPAINTLNRRGYNYNILSPFISAAYNPDDGLYLGASLRYTRHGFRKEPYSMMHLVKVNHALATNAFNFLYNLEAIDVFGKADLVFKGNIKAPNNTINFFKYGNETGYSKGKPEGIRYYRARFNLAEATVMIREKIGQYITLAAGPSFQYFSMNMDDNKNRLITLTALNGLDSNTLFKTKSYAGLQVTTGIDNRNSKLLPSRGLNWQTTLSLNKGLGDYAKNYSQLTSDLSLFMSFNTPAGLVIATRLGGGINFGHYEFFQAQYLSGTENLRGYRKYRFAGDKVVYSNTELRMRLTDLNTYILPGSLGLLCFFDIGRVWVKNESSDTWHNGYGAGVWLAPLKRFVITGCYVASKEGGLPLISFGFQF